MPVRGLRSRMNVLSAFRSCGFRWLAVLVLVVVGGSVTARAQPAKKLRLPVPARGNAAISALGAHLPEVARAYGLDAQRLATLLQTQPSLGIDRDGALIFVCEGLAVGAAGKQGLVTNAAGTDAYSASRAADAAVDAFQLHSLPGATRVLFLDFDGHTTSNTHWNNGFTNGAPIVSQPFDQDGNPGTFSAAERAVIRAIWQRVAEDYAPFAIDVTTQDPGAEALRRTSSGDAAYGIRVVISPTNWYNSGAGGVGYLGSFNWNSDTPCFVFTLSLANAEKYIAEAASHEAGHSVGLMHDGVGGNSPSEYYFGHAQWAPIMGASYYKSVTQFSKGEYANATNAEDDFAVIATYAPLASDDHGNTSETATLLTAPTIADGGTIETQSDVDVFRLDIASGAIALSIKSPSAETNLHLKAELLNAGGQVLLVNNSASLFAEFNTTLSAGTYYLRMSGIGAGDPMTNGYSDYGSLGNYVITGTVTATAAKQAPLAVATSSTTSGSAPLTVTFSAQGSTDADGMIVSYAWNLGNGLTSSAMSPSTTYTTAGTFVATLTVTDNDGLTNSATVSIFVNAPANQAPTAVATSNVQSGPAPLTIAFSGSGSFDPDGTIVSYAWDFGDGSSSTAASPIKTYTVSGNYTAKLVVTDNAGATASATIPISVSAVAANDIDVVEYLLLRYGTGDSFSALAIVFVRDRSNQPVIGATVTIRWSGLVEGTMSATTDFAGRVFILSPAGAGSGAITGEITGLTAPAGMRYEPNLFSSPTTASIGTP
jgi:PKD repeat protein